MAAKLQVFSGIQPGALPENELLIIGKSPALKKLKYETISSKIDKCISQELFEKGLEKLKQSHHIDLYLAHSVSRFASMVANSNNASIVLVVPYDQVIASVCGIARAFPKFNMKSSKEQLKSEDTEETKFESPKERKINIEILLADDEKDGGKSEQLLTPEDCSWLEEVAESVRTTAELVDIPANILHTDEYVQRALDVTADLPGVRQSVIKGEDLRNQGFGGIYSVGKASLHPPAMVILSYTPQDSKETFAIVGKGIVFDTGGTQIKTKTGMPTMKRDMGGSAAVLTAFRSLVLGGFTENLHCILCIAENSIGPTATRPDDIITMLSGKTVEINNTDAEGRLVLGDGVYYAYTVLKANTIIDMATLTGAQKMATGKGHAAILTNSEQWEKWTVEAGRRSGDMVHPLPYIPEVHSSDLNSSFADMKNSNLGSGKGTGTTVAGLFIAAQINFTDDVNWIHCDMAAQVDMGERASGYGVALLACMLGGYTNKVPILKSTGSKE